MSDKLITLSEEQVTRYLQLTDRRMFIIMHSGASWKPEYAQELEEIDQEIAVLRTAIDTAVTARHLAQGHCRKSLVWSWQNLYKFTLQRAGISLTANRMTVRGKGDKDRTVPLGQLTRHFMLEYLSLCPYSDTAVFVNRRGQPLTCNAVKLFVSRLADTLPFELSSHKLRHNFATNYCLDQYRTHGQVDIYRLMYLMGHEDIETTRRYLHMANEILSSQGCISHLDGIMNGEI